MDVDPQSVRAELLAMAAEDQRVREELARSGALFEGYHPRMRELHERNAARLAAIMENTGGQASRWWAMTRPSRLGSFCSTR